jgi:hypothetical protein
VLGEEQQRPKVRRVLPHQPCNWASQ